MGSGLPEGLATGIQTILQSFGHGQRLATSGSEQGNAKSSWCQSLLELGSWFSRNCPRKSHSVPIHHTQRRVNMDTRDVPWHTHIHIPTVQPPCGNLGGVSKDAEILTNAHTLSPSQSSFNKIK